MQSSTTSLSGSTSETGIGFGAEAQAVLTENQKPKQSVGFDSLELAHDIPRLLAELETLKASQQELEAKQYVDASMARFSDLLRWRVDASIEEWADQLLIEIIPYVRGMQAALYVMEPEAAEPHLRLIGTYAAPEDTRVVIRMGEGLTGQTARNARELYLTEGHTFQSHTATSLTQINIGALLILPLVHQEAVEGVLEIGFASPASDHLLVLLRRFASVLAASLGTVRSQVRIQKLYHEAQQYSEQMSAQEEEMRQNLEELQATQEEMRRVQTEIQANERRMKEVADNVPGMVYQYRLNPATGEAGFIYVSNKCRELLGIEAAELMADALKLVVHPEDNDRIMASVGESAQTMAPYKEDARVMVRGDYQWFRLESTPSRQADGIIVWNGYMQNIHAQQLMRKELDEQNQELMAREEEMRQNLEELQATQEQMRKVQADVESSERRMKEIANTVPGMVHQYCLDTKTGTPFFGFVADNAEKLLGITAKDLMADQSLFSIHPDDYDAAMASVAKSAETMTTFNAEVRIKTDKGYRWMRIESVPQLAADGIIAWNGYLQDIDAEYQMRKLVEEQNQELMAREEEMRQNLEELQATQEQMRLTQLQALEQKAFLDSSLNSTEIMFIATDKEGTIKYWNSAAERQLGYTQDEIVNKLSPAVFHDLNEIVAEANRLSQEYNTTIEPGFGVFGFLPYQAKTYIRDWTYINKNGRRFPVELAISAWKDAKGEYAGLLGIALDITSRKEMARQLSQQQEELMASEEELRQNLEELQATQEEMQRQQDMIAAVIDGSEDTILALDINYDLLLMNKKLRANYEGSDLRIERGISVFSLLPPDQHDWYRNCYDRALRGERFQENAHYQFAGLDIHYRISYFPMLNKTSEIIGIGIIGTDISELVNKEREMASQRNIMNAIIEGSDDSTLVVNRNLELLVLNEKMRVGLRNYSQKEPQLGQHLLELFPEEGREMQLQMYSQVLNGERIKAVQEYPDPAQNGKITHIEIEYFPVRDESGDIFGAACVARDVSVLKQNELAIARQRDIVTSLMDGTEDSISIVDLEYNILACNKAVSDGLEAWTGRKVELGANMLDYLPAEQHEYHRALFSRALAGERFNIEAQYPQGDEVGYFSIDYFPVRNDAGEIFGMASIARNVTAQKKAEYNVRIKDALFQNTHDAQWILEGPALIACNPASVRLFEGQSQADLLGKSPIDFSPPTQPNGQDSLSAAMAQIGRAMEEGTNSFEWTHRKLTGEDFPATIALTRLDFEGRSLLAASIRDRSKEAAAEQLAANEALRLTLTRDANLMQGNVEDAIRILTEQLANQLAVNQVGVWKLNETGIVSVDVYTVSENSHTAGFELPKANYPKYFAAIGSGKVVSAPEAATHPHTAEFKDYFAEHGITSLLDVPVVVNGNLWGVVCLEHTGAVRQWTDQDIAIARTIADFVATSLQNADTRNQLANSSESLARSEQRMTTAFKLAKMGYWDWNLLTNEVFFGDTWFEQFGYSPSQFPHEFETFVKLCHPDDFADVTAKIKATIEQNVPYETTMRMKNAKGKWVNAKATGAVHRDEAGTPLYFSGIQWVQ